jgi:hypothetical protein
VESATATEGINPSITFRITASNPGAVSHNVSASYRTVNSSAVSPADYQSQTGTVTFSPTQTVTSVTIPIVDDSIQETTEYFMLQLSNFSRGAAAGTNSGIGSIMDNDGPVRVFVDDAVVVREGQISYFTVRVDNPVRTVEGTFKTFSGSATQDSDYLGVDVPFIIPAGTQSITIGVQTYANNDPPEQNIENFTAKVSNLVGATAGDSEGLGAIQETSVPLSIWAYGNIEGDASPKYLEVFVFIPPSFTQTASLSFHTEDRTAIAYSDYLPLSGTINFVKGWNQPSTNLDYAARILIPTVPDWIVETPKQEKLAFVVDSLSNAYLNGAQPETTLTITDDDDIPVLSVRGGTANEGSNVPFVFTLS